MFSLLIFALLELKSPLPLSPSDEPSLLVMYAIPLSVGLVTMVLLWNLVLLCKVQFARDRTFTKLSFKPYVLSFAFLASQLIETCILEYENERDTHRRSADKGRTVIFSFEFQAHWTQALFSLKFLLYYAFLMM